jgi:hypothetical protein
MSRAEKVVAGPPCPFQAQDPGLVASPLYMLISSSHVVIVTP